jgi:hypothetical protein
VGTLDCISQFHHSWNDTSPLQGVNFSTKYHHTCTGPACDLDSWKISNSSEMGCTHNYVSKLTIDNTEILLNI